MEATAHASAVGTGSGGLNSTTAPFGGGENVSPQQQQQQQTKLQLQGTASAPSGSDDAGATSSAGPTTTTTTTTTTAAASSGGTSGTAAATGGAGGGDKVPGSGAKPKLHTSWSEEEREQHANIMAHQQALRRATHLRQRKISTELKLETIQKQLRRAKKTQPKAIPEEGGNDRLAFEEQLQELTETLKTLEGNLGQTELEAQKTKRNWDSKMEEVYKHIYDPATILNIDQWAERKNTGGRASTRRIGGGSLRVRAAKFIQSPRPKKKPHDTPSSNNNNNNDGSNTNTATNTTSTNNNNSSNVTGSNKDSNNHDKHGSGGGSNVEDSDTDEKSSGARALGAKQGRRGTFRVFGSLLDSKRGRFGGSGKQQHPPPPAHPSPQQQQQQHGSAGQGGHHHQQKQQPLSKDPNNTLSGSLKQKGDATSSSSIEQEKENGEHQSCPAGCQMGSNQENIRPGSGSTSASQDEAIGIKGDTGKAMSAPATQASSPRPEIPRWVLDEIEMFEQLIRDYQTVHGKVVDIFET